MCGIAGLISLNDMPVESDSIRQMVVALKHRGPDAQTIHVDGPVALGHARLSIIDLAAGHQPLFNEDRSIAVVCNGEIYNYRELRSQLVQRGHQFRTGSDCEVLTHLWEERGGGMVDELRGMFAFILFDRRRGIVFGARDRFGQSRCSTPGLKTGLRLLRKLRDCSSCPTFLENWISRDSTSSCFTSTFLSLAHCLRGSRNSPQEAVLKFRSLPTCSTSLF